MKELSEEKIYDISLSLLKKMDEKGISLHDTEMIFGLGWAMSCFGQSLSKKDMERKLRQLRRMYMEISEKAIKMQELEIE